MSSKSKIRGTRWESEVRDYLNSAGFETFRPALHGGQDKGDIFGLRDWAIQCRDTARIDLAGSVNDGLEQAANKGAPFFAVITKRRRKPVGAAYVTLDLTEFTEILKRLETLK